MRDFVADWNKWSRAERVLAVVVTVMMVALPLGLLITGKAEIRLLAESVLPIAARR